MFFSTSALLAFFLSLFLIGQVSAAPFPMVMVAATEKSLKLRDVPVQQASKSDGTEVVPYDRRDVPEEDPSKSDGGNIVPYTRRDVPEQDPSKADNGNIVPYKRSSYIPLELAVRSVDGVVELY